MHDAVAGETARAQESVQLAHRAEYRMRVGRVLVESGPAGLDRGFREGRDAVERTLDDGRKEFPADVLSEAGRLVTVRHAQEDPARLAAGGEAGREVAD